MEIYAEISNKLLREIEEMGKNLDLPSGVTMQRKPGSRACYLECDEFSKDELVEFLESNGISWQVIPEAREDKEDRKEDRQRRPKRSGFKEFDDSWSEFGYKPSKKKRGDFKEFRDPWNEDEDY